ncbi:MAG: hypothetical protein NC911_00995 [Candidatus Omnitrophica bacterium]|nr:hypothetical protein [Candidatus Omnitrophota bacterium]
MHKILVAATLIHALLFYPVYAHLCDNVFRQADKLIVKPETYNLSVRDSATFKIFLQNNMDRGIAEISLQAESPAFSFTISPNRMSIPKDQRVYFTVTMVPKPGIRTGNYPISFRLVGGGREFKSFSLAGQREDSGIETKKEERPSVLNPDSLLQVKKIQTGPRIDGIINEDCWKEAAVASNFTTRTGNKPTQPTVCLLIFDQQALYLGFYCREENLSLLSDKDKLEIFLSPTAEGRASYALTLTSTGTLAARQLDSAGNWKPWISSQIRSATNKGFSSWSAEIAIPFVTLGISPPVSPAVWSFTVVRSRAAGQGEETFWAADASGYHRSSGTGFVLLKP